jgi:hypothetical protein
MIVECLLLQMPHGVPVCSRHVSLVALLRTNDIHLEVEGRHVVELRESREKLARRVNTGYFRQFSAAISVVLLPRSLCIYKSVSAS